MRKKEGNNIWKDWRIWLIILLLILFSFSFSDNDDYGYCLDDCLYENEFCSDGFQVYSGESWWMLREVYDECHYDLRNCIEGCER